MFFQAPYCSPKKEMTPERKKYLAECRKRKFVKGEPIMSIGELCDQEFVYYFGKRYHIGFIKSWPLALALRYIAHKMLYRAIEVTQS